MLIIINKIRSILFDIFICTWGAIIPIIYSPVFITKSSKMADKGAKNWARFSLFILDKICGIKYQIKGIENIPKENGFIVACKHQSMWETIVMHLIFDRPVYTWKKELLKIPFYGWFLNYMSGITIDRKGGAKSLKNLINQTQKFLDNKQNIIIFPQGTRTPIGSNIKDYPYQPGIAALYTKLNAQIVPAALNSGVYWNKKGKKSGIITLEFLPAIEPNLDKKSFLKILEDKIETKSNQLEKIS